MPPLLSDRLTVCLFAWNEEQRILRSLENFRGLFRVLVVDNCSTDRTAEVARGASYELTVI
ncbi:glycosyltransferase [Xylophilus rhododendri]|uniref:Glycosyltransferase n=1 Tax=Xylophilus rhododendri TaxID=2697032 RepID=A0A857J8W7_9BURK|nr:glycosyltransferase [Xylophilus rhododendri]